MPEIFDLIIVLIIGFAGGFVGSVAAGAGLIVVPGLLLLGIPPQIALATGKFGNFGFKIGSFIKFTQHKLYVKKLILPMSIISIAGATLGARLLLEINDELLSKIVGVILILLLPMLFLKKGIGTVQKQVTKAKQRIAHVLYFIAKTWGGFFGPGSGFFALFVSLNVYGLTILQAKGTSRIPDILGTIAAVSVFIFAGVIDYWIGVILIVSMFIGGYVGAHVAIKKGDAWIKPIMAVFIVVVAIKMIFF